jgi:hypothetical protein
VWGLEGLPLYYVSEDAHSTSLAKILDPWQKPAEAKVHAISHQTNASNDRVKEETKKLGARS